MAVHSVMCRYPHNVPNFLPTVKLRFRPFGLELACVYLVGIAAPNRAFIWEFLNLLITATGCFCRRGLYKVKYEYA
jgi:hypothetical protein